MVEELTLPARAKAGIMLIILLVVLSWLWAAPGVAEGYAALGGEDDISWHEARVHRIRTVLPPRGIVGYIAYPDNPWVFQTTQYALAPLVLVNSTDLGPLVGIFPPGMTPTLTDTNGKNIPVKDFGNGVFLIGGGGE